MSDMPEPLDIGRSIKILRVAKMDWTLRELSAAAGVSLSMLSDLENGRRNATIDTVAKLASAFQIKASDLIILAETRDHVCFLSGASNVE